MAGERGLQADLDGGDVEGLADPKNSDDVAVRVLLPEHQPRGAHRLLLYLISFLLLCSSTLTAAAAVASQDL